MIIAYIRVQDQILISGSQEKKLKVQIFDALTLFGSNQKLWNSKKIIDLSEGFYWKLAARPII